MNFKKQNKNNKKIILAGFIVLHLMYAGFWGWMKKDCYVDEYWTYGLANNVGSITMQVEDGKSYNGTYPFDRYMTVEKGETFNYSNVWTQQAADVHPPLYYIIIHTLCSFFPGVFSKWFGLLPNFCCLILIDILLYQIGKVLLKSESLALIAVIINGTGVMMMNMVIFIRMYALLTMITMAIVLMFLKYLERKKSAEFWIQLYFLSVLGTMTQYYFLILLFFLCMFQGIVFLRRHKWKDTVYFLITLMMAGITSILIFPPIVVQVFGNGYRGREARANLVSLSNLAGSIIEYVGLITKEIFGGHIVGVIFFLTIIFLACRKKFLKFFWSELKLGEYLLLTMTVGYLLIIIKIAPYRVDRYIMCIGWCIILLSIDVVYQILCFFKGNWGHKKKYILCFLLFMGLNVSSMTFLGWELPYAYVGNKERLEALFPYLNCSVIFVYEKGDYALCTNYNDLPLYKNYCYVNADDFPELIRSETYDDFVLYIGQGLEIDTVLQEAIAGGQWYTTQSLGKYGRADVYYLSK